MDLLDNEDLREYIDELSKEVNAKTLKPEWAMWRVVGFVKELAKKEMERLEYRRMYERDSNDSGTP